MERRVRRSRWYVAGSTALAVAAGYWIADVPLYALLPVVVVLAAGHAYLFRGLRWRSPHQPAELLLGTHRGTPAFVPVRAQVASGSLLIVVGLVIGVRLGAGGDFVPLVFFGAVAAYLGHGVFFRSPVALRPDGIADGKRLITWDELWPVPPVHRGWALQVPVRPESPAAPAQPQGVSSATWQRISDRGLETNVNALLAEEPSLLRPENPAEGPAWVAIDLRPIAVDSGFLIDAIRFYQENPDARAGIGTAEGYARLLASR